MIIFYLELTELGSSGVADNWVWVTDTLTFGLNPLALLLSTPFAASFLAALAPAEGL